MKKKVAIIGGVAGGAAAAAMLRRLEKDTEIIMFEKGAYISYANCGLPYMIGRLVDDEELMVLTPEEMREQKNIEVRIFSEVLRIDRSGKTLLVKDHRTGGEYRESYDKLIIATGASPLKTDVPGADLPNVFTLWTMADAKAIRDYLKDNPVKRAVVAGGGFVSLEITENFRRIGLDVTVIQSPSQLLKQIDPDMIGPFQENFKQNGVQLILQDRVKEIKRENGASAVLTKQGLTVPADIVVLAVGVRPNSALAADAGLETGVKGGIVTDEYLRTSDPDIYAVGDVIQVEDFVNKVPTVVPLAGPAKRQGRIAAENIAGKQTVYAGTLGSFIVGAFGMTAASTGTSESTLNRLGRTAGTDYGVVKIESPSHAPYYPGAEKMTVKVLFSLPGGKILGVRLSEAP
jgi:NADPH-dependent 2,4-dienoyl-CoA reductase/sulfur reductase-like enzyme